MEIGLVYTGNPSYSDAESTSTEGELDTMVLTCTTRVIHTYIHIHTNMCINPNHSDVLIQ